MAVILKVVGAFLFFFIGTAYNHAHKRINTFRKNIHLERTEGKMA